MRRQERLDFLLEQWEAERGQGRQVSADELCRDCPELREDLDRQIHARAGQAPPASPDCQAGVLTVAPAAPRATDAMRGNSKNGSNKDTAPEGPLLDGPNHVLPPTLAEGHKPSTARAGSGTTPNSIRTTADSSGELVPGGGGYRKLKRLGRGSFAEVWLAEAPGGVKVALKMVSRPVDHVEAQRELQAVELVCGLRHPFLLQTHSYWTVEDRLYIAMELADCTLRDRLKECRNQGMDGIPFAELLLYTRHSAEALDFLHERHVQHRDVKPENILLMANFAKLADFGLARSQGSRQFASMSMSMGGTPMYMGPEVWTGKISAHTDQYALAMTYAELRLGRRVLPGNDLVALMNQHLGSMPQLDPLPPAEQEALRRALAKEPHDRYPSCLAFVDALAEAAAPAKAPPAPLPVAVPPAPPEPVQSRRWLLTLLGLLVIGVGACLVALLGPMSFQLETPPAIFLTPGGQGTGVLQLRRHWFPYSIGLLPRDGAPAPVQVSVGEQAEDGQVSVKVTAAADTPWGTHEVILNADGGGQHREAVLPVHVIYLPSADWEPVGEARQQDRDGHWFAERLRRKVGEQTVEMILIPRSVPQTANEPEMPTYYLMETKVTVGMFRAFAASQKPTSDAWQQAVAGEKHPVFDVTVVDAFRFARWLGGNLPTADQWDKAAGLYRADRGEGPYRGHWDTANPLRIAVGGAEKPSAPVGASADDVSWCQCRDMAGNGFEWTRELQGGRLRFVPVEKLTGNEFFYLRGSSFRNDDPMKFADLLKGHSAVAGYSNHLNNRGFRVVLEPGSPGKTGRTGSSTLAGSP